MKKSKSALMRILSLALVMATILALFSVETDMPVISDTCEYE